MMAQSEEGSKALYTVHLGTLWNSCDSSQLKAILPTSLQVKDIKLSKEVRGLEGAEA